MKSTDPLLSPDAAPGGVRRANNTPVVLVVLLGFLVIGALVWVGQQRLEAQEARTEAIEKGPERSKNGRSAAMLAGDLLGDMQTAGIVAPEAPPAPDPEPVDEPAPASAAQPSLAIARGKNAPPPPPRDNLPNVDPAFLRTREAQIKAFEAAVTAEVTVKNTNLGRAGGRSTSTPSEQLAQIQAAKQRLAHAQAQAGDPSQAFMAKLNQLRGMATAAGAPGAAAADDLTSQAAIAARNRAAYSDAGQFDNKGGGDRWALGSQREAPPSPYTFSAGSGVIPARLTRGINSELPGQVTALVTRNVYDTATGRHLLIPQGTQIAGQYSSQVIFGQSAVLTGWQRFIFPDGSRLDIGSMPGADASGYAGFRDLVDNHYLRIYGSALLMSGIVAGVAMSQPQSNDSSGNNNRTSASDAMSEALGQQLGQVTAQQISKNLNIAPTLQIRPGYEINVVPTKDLVFSKPYKPFDY